MVVVFSLLLAQVRGWETWTRYLIRLNAPKLLLSVFGGPASKPLLSPFGGAWSFFFSFCFFSN